VAPPPIPALAPTNGGAGHALPTQQPSALPSPPFRPPDAQSVVDRLIEGTLLPAPLPGLELRLVQPEEHAVNETNSPADDPKPTPVGEETQPEPPERAPALDLDALADRIYETLQQRRQFEQERRGLY